MSYCREQGKDKLIFVTEEDHSKPSEVILSEDDEDEYEGLIKPSGDINWDCPCLQGMADGPCGEEFKAAFSCFHYSEVEPKGSDCIPQFRDMQICFQKYPEIYGKDDKEEEESEEKDNDESTGQIKGESAVVLSSDDELESNVKERSVAKASASAVPQNDSVVGGTAAEAAPSSYEEIKDDSSSYEEIKVNS